MDSDRSPPPPPREGSSALRVVWFAVRFLLPFAVVVAGLFVGLHLLETGPSAERRPPAKRARLVEVVPARRTDARTVVRAMGTVRPAREVVLQPRVEGEIVEVSDRFVPGARVAAGETLLRIDPTDYELLVRQREGELAKARADLMIEEGNQIVARREFELLGQDVPEEDRALLLRAPQLATVKAAVKTAEAALEKARLDLARTVVVAPFNAVIRERMADLGAQITRSSSLAALVGTDEYWVELSVRVADLRWIRLPTRPGEPGSETRVYDEAAWGSGRHRTGRVLGLTSELEPEGRMARLLVSVSDPLDGDNGADAPALLLGSYVRAEIEGLPLRDVVPVDRTLMREGDSVWLMDDDRKLEIRPVEIAFREKDVVYVSGGLEAGERIVASSLASPVEGMLLRLAEEEAPGDEGPPEEREPDGSVRESGSPEAPR